MDQVWEIVKIIGAVIASISAPVVAMYALIAHNKKIRLWFTNKRKRREALDEIIASAMAGSNCLTCNVGELAGLIEKQAKNIDQLAEAVATVAKQNGYQDAEIARSREQRRVHDIAIFAVVDWIKGNGGNGPINKAHEELFNYLREEAHTPIGGDVDCHA